MEWSGRCGEVEVAGGEHSPAAAEMETTARFRLLRLSLLLCRLEATEWSTALLEEVLAWPRMAGVDGGGQSRWS